MAVGVVGTEVISAPWEYPEIGGLTTVKKATPIGIGLTILFTPSKAGETEEDLKNDAEFQKAIASGGTGDPNNGNKKKKDGDIVDKQKKRIPRNNKAQNKQFRDVVKKLKLNKVQQRLLHEEITGQGYSYQEILEIAKYMFNK